MEMKRCEKGHFYDASRTSTCPYCNGNSGPINLTRPLDSNTEDISKTQPISENNKNSEQTRPTGIPVSNHAAQGDSEKTVAIIKKDIGIDPVVGWLVCTEGGDKGRDYRIHGERNFIGRSEKMDICIHGDDTVSREAHAIISYDRRKNKFRLYEGESKGIVYLNDEEVVTALILAPYDLIEIGKTKLLFIPFCEERFKWD